MIPKVVHYCWLSGDPFPEHIRQCIDSWKKYLPDYDFMLWDRKRFPKGKSIWVDQAFANKKYAFAADYIRLYALYHFGGFYLDCDVEVLKPFKPFMDLDTMICWQKEIPGLEVAAFGVSAKNPWMQLCLNRYLNRPFILENGTFDTKVLPEVIEGHLSDNGYSFIDVKSVEEAIQVKGEKCIPVFPCEFFSPKSYLTKKIELTSNSYCIHHFDGSWKRKRWYEVLDDKFTRLFPNGQIRPFEGLVRRSRKIFKKHQRGC